MKNKTAKPKITGSGSLKITVSGDSNLEITDGLFFFYFFLFLFIMNY